MTNQSALIADTASNPYGPLTPTEILQRTFAMYREHPSLVFGLMLLMAISQLIFTGMMTSVTALMHLHTGANTAPLQMLFYVCILFFGMGVLYVLTQIVQGAYFYAVRFTLQRQSMSVGDACSLALGRIGSLVGVSVQVALRMLGWEILIVLVLSGVGLGAALASGVFGLTQASLARQWMHYAILLVPVVLLLAAVYVAALFWLLARYAIAIPSCLAENLPASDAVRRAIALSSKSRGRIYALYFFLLVVVAANLAIQVPLLIFTAHAGIQPIMTAFLHAVSSAVNLIVGAWTVSWMGMGISFAYYDLRARKDGFGMVAAASPSVGLEQAPDSQIATALPAVDAPANILPEHDL